MCGKHWLKVEFAYLHACSLDGTFVKISFNAKADTVGPTVLSDKIALEVYLIFINS